MGLFLGLLIGLFIGVMISFVVYIFIDEFSDNIIINTIVLTGITTICIFISAYIGMQTDQIYYNKEVVNWEKTKFTLEETIRDETITDLAKISLIDKAINYNKKLTELKEDVKQWWYFYLDESKVEKLEYIDITIKSERRGE